MKKPSTRKRLSVWSQAVRDRDQHTCQVCGKTQKQLKAKSFLNAHHLIEKNRLKDLKFDINMGITLCPNCHKFGVYSAHNHPLWFAAWMQAHKPKQYQYVMGVKP